MGQIPRGRAYSKVTRDLTVILPTHTGFARLLPEFNSANCGGETRSGVLKKKFLHRAGG